MWQVRKQAERLQHTCFALVRVPWDPSVPDEDHQRLAEAEAEATTADAKANAATKKADGTVGKRQQEADAAAREAKEKASAAGDVAAVWRRVVRERKVLLLSRGVNKLCK